MTIGDGISIAAYVWGLVQMVRCLIAFTTNRNTQHDLQKRVENLESKVDW